MFKNVKYFIKINYYIILGGENSNFRPHDMAIREKELGNECFKSNDYEEALGHYNSSIKIHSTLEAKNNRAMACKSNNSLDFVVTNLSLQYAIYIIHIIIIYVPMCNIYLEII